MKTFDRARSEEIAIEVALETALHLRPQHLDGDLSPLAVVDHDSLVYLRDGRSGNGRTERGEMILDAPAKRGLDGGARFGLRDRRHAVLETREIAAKVRPDHIGARRQDLPKLDVARPEPCQGRADARLHALTATEGPCQRLHRPRRRTREPERDR